MVMVNVALNPLWSRIWFPLVSPDCDGSEIPFRHDYFRKKINKFISPYIVIMYHIIC